MAGPREICVFEERIACQAIPDLDPEGWVAERWVPEGWVDSVLVRRLFILKAIE
jgi:hypothetical protein